MPSNRTQLLLNWIFVTFLQFQEEIIDGTFTTYSTLTFVATRFENGVNFRCDADNIVMQNELEKPLHNSLFLIVMCKLSIRVNRCVFTLWNRLLNNIQLLFFSLFGRSAGGNRNTAQFTGDRKQWRLFGLPIRFESVVTEARHLVNFNFMRCF